MTSSIVVAGAPGSGKTTLVAHLARILELPVRLPMDGATASQAVDAARFASLGVAMAGRDAGKAIVETCAYGASWQGEAGIVIVVIDALSAAAGFSDTALSAIAQADLIALSRTDLVDPASARDSVAAVAQCSIVDVVHGKLPPELLPTSQLRPICLAGWQKAETWSYAGAARLEPALAESFLQRRPRGVTRIKGRALSGKAGLVLDQSGRARSVSPCEPPAETLLFAAGKHGAFHENDMAVHFAETASTASASAGWFGFR